MAASNSSEPSCVAAIFFDLDNTLIQTRKADSKTCKKFTPRWCFYTMRDMPPDDVGYNSDEMLKNPIFSTPRLINGILTEEYGVPSETADRATSSFLRAFRRCPDNPECDLDTWRIHLWSQALGEEYSNLADDIYLQWLDLRYHYLVLSSEILSLLVSLRKHYLLGLITNGTSRAQWEKVERLKLKCYFDCILVSGDLPWEKPDQKIFQEACQFLGVEPKNCIMVGDKLETDIQGGIEAELGGTVWIPLTPEETEESNNVTPDFTIDSVTQLPEVLLANATLPNRPASRDGHRPAVSEPRLSDISSLSISDEINDNKLS